jgi:hypothetical protein
MYITKQFVNLPQVVVGKNGTSHYRGTLEDPVLSEDRLGLDFSARQPFRKLA